MKKKIAIILSFVVFVLSLSALCACTYGNGITIHGGLNYDNAESYSTGNFTYDSSTVTRVEIEWVMGDINLVQGSESTLSVSESGENLSNEQKMHYLISGNTLKIKFWKSRYSDKNVKEKDKNLTVEVPDGAELYVATVSGKIKSNYLLASSVKVESVSAEVNLVVVDCNDIDVESVSGNVKIGLCGNGATVNFETVSGSYSSPFGGKVIGDGKIKVDVKTVSGSLKVE